MGRSGWESAFVWTLATLGGFALLGYAFNIPQLGFLVPLFLWSAVAAVIIPSVLRGVGEFRAGNDWTRLSGLVPVATIVLIGILVLWWLGFLNRHLSGFWLFVIVAAFIALGVLRQVAEKYQTAQRIKAIKETPPPPPRSASQQASKDQLKAKGLIR